MVLLSVAKPLKDDTMTRMNKFRAHARRLVATHVRLAAEPSESQLVALIQSTVVGQARGVQLTDSKGCPFNKSFVRIIYDVKTAGRTSTAPHLRAHCLAMQSLASACDYL